MLVFGCSESCKFLTTFLNLNNWMTIMAKKAKKMKKAKKAAPAAK
jgi:hypothetical protein